MTAIPRYRALAGPVILSAGFRPFFLGSAIWAAVAIPLWLCAYTEGLVVPTQLAAFVWHAHEMIFGFAAATVAGFLLTAIPNWTGRMPLQGAPLGALVLLWAIGRLAVLLSAVIGAPAAAVADLLFPAAFLAVIAREILPVRTGATCRYSVRYHHCSSVICSFISRRSGLPTPPSSAIAWGLSHCLC